jgi:hypothetical protein
MNKVQTAFKLIDNAIFQLMDNIKASDFSQKLNQQMQQFSPEVQKIINQSINVLLFLIPMVIVLIMALSNLSSRSEANKKIEILELINSYSKKKSEAITQSRSVISPKVFSKQSDFETQLMQSYRLSGIDQSKMKVSGFIQDSSIKPLLKSEAKIRFNNLTMTNITGFILTLLKDYKTKITSINIELQKGDRTLSGSLDLIHYSKINK